jgi:hypothetical protein
VDGSSPLGESIDIDTERERDRERDMEVGIDAEDIETKRDVDVNVNGLTSLEVGERVAREMHSMDVIDSTSSRAIPIESNEISSSISQSGAKIRSRLPSESRGTGTTTTAATMGSALDGMKAFWGAVVDSSALPHSSTPDGHDRASDGRTDADVASIRHLEAVRSDLTPEGEEMGEHDDDNDDDYGGEVMGSGEEGSSAGASKRFRRHTIAY